MIEVSTVSTATQAPRIWLPLADLPKNAPEGAEAPGVHLRPLPWTELTRLEQLSQEPYVLNGKRSYALNHAHLFELLIEATEPDNWRGFGRDGQEIPFDRETLLQVLCTNLFLGKRFKDELALRALKMGQQEDAEGKNSGAGHATPSSAPGKGKMTAS